VRNERTKNTAPRIHDDGSIAKAVAQATAFAMLRRFIQRDENRMTCVPAR